jgi:hypothetical protein
MSILELVSCGRQIIVSVLADEAIDLLDIYSGQTASVLACADVLDIITTDPAASGFLSIRDRAGILIFTRASDFINIRAA